MSHPLNSRYSNLDCSKDKIRTKQSFKNQSNINTIMDKFTKTGMITPDQMAKRAAIYGDVSEIGDFQTAQNKVIEGKAAFMTLSAQIRNRFNNNPGDLLDFLTIPENREEAIKLGILQKPEQVKEPTPATPAEPKPTA